MVCRNVLSETVHDIVKTSFRMKLDVAKSQNLSYSSMVHKKVAAQKIEFAGHQLIFAVVPQARPT